MDNTKTREENLENLQEDEFVDEEVEVEAEEIEAEKGRKKKPDPDLSAEPVYEEPSFLNQYIERYKFLLIGAVGIAFIGLAYLGYNTLQESNQEEGSIKSIQAFKYFEKDSIDKAINGDGANPGLKQLVDDYGSTKVGNLCKFMLGSSYYAKGDIKNGLEQFEDFNTDKNMVSVSALSAVAYGYEESKDFKQAADYYLKAASLMENGFTSPGFMQQAARCYEEANMKEEALELYKEIKRKYPLSESGKAADKYIAKLSDK